MQRLIERWVRSDSSRTQSRERLKRDANFLKREFSGTDARDFFSVGRGERLMGLNWSHWDAGQDKKERDTRREEGIVELVMIR